MIVFFCIFEEKFWNAISTLIFIFAIIWNLLDVCILLLHTYIHQNGVSSLIISQTSNFHTILLQSCDKTALWIGKKNPDLCLAIQYIDYSSCLLMPPARSVYFHSFLSTITSSSFNCDIKNIPSLPFASPPAIQNRAKKGKLLSDKFFSTFLNYAALVKTFLISGRRSGSDEGRERTFAESLIFLFQRLQQPPDLIKNATVRSLFFLCLGIEEETGKNRCREGKVSWSCARSPGRFPRSLISLFASFLHLRRGDYHLEDAFSSIAYLVAPRRRRRLDEIFIETPVDYSDAMCARANSRDCEFIWWCNCRRAV